MPRVLYVRHSKRTSKWPVSLHLGFVAIIKYNKDYLDTALQHHNSRSDSQEGYHLTNTQAVNTVWTCWTKGWVTPRQDRAAWPRTSSRHSNPWANYNLQIVYLWNFLFNILRPWQTTGNWNCGKQDYIGGTTILCVRAHVYFLNKSITWHSFLS